MHGAAHMRSSLMQIKLTVRLAASVAASVRTTWGKKIFFLYTMGGFCLGFIFSWARHLPKQVLREVN